MNVLLAILLTIGGFVFIWAVIRLIAGPATPTANRYTYEVDAQGNEYVRDHTDRGYAEAEVEKAIDPYVAQIVKHVNERGPSASAFTGKGDLPMPELLDWIDEKNIRSTESEKANAARVSAANESLKRKADTTSDQTIPVVLAAVAVASVLDSSSSNYDSGGSDSYSSGGGD